MKRGVTLPELLITMGIAAILFTIGTVSFANLQSDSQLDLYASEAKDYMLKAQARTLNHIPAGVYFEPTRFVYYEGDAYVEGLNLNEEVVVPNGLTIGQITFAANTLTFEAVTGNVASYTDPSHMVITETGTGKTRTITVSQNGVVRIN